MRAIAAAAACLLSGCVTIPETPIAEAPTCRSEADCTVKWAAARTFVLDHADMKIQTYSPDFIQTYSPARSTDLAALVNKEPLPDGGYRIAARFWCDNEFGCSSNPRETLDAFNREVASIESTASR